MDEAQEGLKYIWKYKFQFYVVFGSAIGLKIIFGVYGNILIKFVEFRGTLNTFSLGFIVQAFTFVTMLQQ